MSSNFYLSGELQKALWRATESNTNKGGNKDLATIWGIIYQLVAENNAEIAHFLNDYDTDNRVDLDKLLTKAEQFQDRDEPLYSHAYRSFEGLAKDSESYKSMRGIQRLDSVCMLDLVYNFGTREQSAVLDNAGFTDTLFRYYINDNIQHLIVSDPENEHTLNDNGRDVSSQSNGQTNKKDTALEQFGTDLSQKAANGGIDRAVGRDSEVDHAVKILKKRKRNTPLLVGEAGVGKTAIVGELARRIYSGEVPQSLKDATLIELNIGALQAGTNYRGDFEKRVENIFKEIDKRTEKGEFPVLFIDELHTIVGAGATSGGTLDLANMLKTRLAEGKLALIGATTHEEKKHIEKDQALNRRFQVIQVDEPDLDRAVEMVKSQLDMIARHHNVQFTEGAAYHLAVSVKRHFGGDLGRSPDKEIDIADDAAAEVAMENDIPVSDNGEEQAPVVTLDQLNRVIESMRGLPEGTLSMSDKQRIQKLAENLPEFVFGQDDYIRGITRTMKSNYALGDGRKPMGSFLLAGGRGSGKTETARGIAKLMNMDLIRYDMQEFSESLSVSAVIGTSAGYVGYGDDTIVDQVRKNPRGVFLFDEIEKAHPDVQKIFMQILENGEITDRKGRKARFDQATIIMTTNAGAEAAHKQGIGFTMDEKVEKPAKQALKEDFANPEFLDRFDGIHIYNDITKDAQVQQAIVNKFLTNTTDKLARKWDVEATIDDSVTEHVRQQAISPTEGARPVERYIKGTIEQELSDALLDEDIPEGSHIRIDLAPGGSDQTITYHFLGQAVPQLSEEPDRQDTKPALASANCCSYSEPRP